MIYIILTMGVILLIYLFATPKTNNKNKSALMNLMKNQEQIMNKVKELNIENKIEYYSKDYSSGIVLDEINKKIHIFQPKHKNVDGSYIISHNKFDFNDIIESEVIINSKSIVKTVRSNQIAGALIGNMIAGGLGMVIGGLSSEKINIDKIKNIDLKITVNDISSPVYKVNFLNQHDPYFNYYQKEGYDKESVEYKTAIKQVDKWQGIMDILLKQNNKSLSI